MSFIQELINSFGSTVLTTLFFIAIYVIVQKLLSRQRAGQADKAMLRQIILFSIAITGVIAVILALPMSNELRGQITSLMGIVISAVFALSSATFIGNMLAGILLRTVNSYKPGDFIQVQDAFGRVSERGLFHTEIQTINRDLITLPNLYIATNPVKVTRSSGSFICVSVSLGYDVNRLKIQKCLLDAAKRANLKDAFVLITTLGDFSVVYEIHGLLDDVKRVLTAKSTLHGFVLDSLHEAGIEIVSPNFMNQRQVGETIFIPKKVRSKIAKETEAPEALIFDKADKAASIEGRKENLAKIDAKLKELQEALKVCTEEEKADIQERIDRWNNMKASLAEKIDAKIEEMGKEK